MQNYSPPTSKRTPAYKQWWFFTLVFLGLVYAASIAAVPLLQKRLQEKFYSPVTIMYKWTDENDVAHYSDIKPDVPAEEVPFISNTPAPDTVDLIEMKVFMASHTIKPVLGKLLIVFIVAIALVKSITSACVYARRRKAGRTAKAFTTTLEACVQKATDFSSALIAADMDKTRYTTYLGELKNALEGVRNNPRALEYEYGKVIEYLQQAFETYIDCHSLWDVKSQRDITTSDKNDFMRKYPNLLDRTTGVDKPLPPKELRKAVRTTIWDYASRYVVQAERLFATAKGMEEKSKPDAQPEPENSIDPK
jgi:hypothetical protein